MGKEKIHLKKVRGKLEVRWVVLKNVGKKNWMWRKYEAKVNKNFAIYEPLNRAERENTNA